MKITIYELLGMVKDRKAPYKVKYQNEIYIMDDLEYFYANESRKALFESVFDNYSDYEALNEEVEILDDEEKELPKKLKSLNNVGNSRNIVEFEDKQQLNNHLLKDKLNEIIDYLEKQMKGE